MEVTLVIWIALWYLFTSLSNIASKEVLNSHCNDSFFLMDLALWQFFVGGLMGTAFLLMKVLAQHLFKIDEFYQNHDHDQDHDHDSSQPMIAKGSNDSSRSTRVGVDFFSSKMVFISFCHCTGVVLTNYCIGVIGSTITQVLKTWEPLSVAVLSLIIADKNYTSSTVMWSSLVLITSGVMLLISQPGILITKIGLLAAITSNFALPCRNIAIRNMFMKSNNGSIQAGRGLDNINNKSNSSNMKSDNINHTIFLYSSTQSFLFLLIVVMIKVFVMDQKFAGIDSAIAFSGFLLNGYQLASFSVLSYMSAIDHSVANVFKRVFAVSASVLYFQESMSLPKLMGLQLSFFGLFLYDESKRKVDVSGTLTTVSFSNLDFPRLLRRSGVVFMILIGTGGAIWVNQMNVFSDQSSFYRQFISPRAIELKVQNITQTRVTGPPESNILKSRLGPIIGNTYVINLDRRIERMELTRLQLEYLNISYTRISAVDGKQLESWMHTISYWNNSDLKTHSGHVISKVEPLSPSMHDFGMDPRSKFFLQASHFDYTKTTLAQVGCQQSHLVVFYRIIDAARDTGVDMPTLVLEDDVLFEKKAVFMIQEIFQLLPDDWELLALGSFDDFNSCVNVISDRLCKQTKLLYGTHAYIIRNASAAQKLVDWSNEVWPRPADHVYAGHLNGTNPDFNVYQVYPNFIAAQDRRHMASDIVTTDSQLKTMKQYIGFEDLIIPYSSIKGHLHIIHQNKIRPSNQTITTAKNRRIAMVDSVNSTSELHDTMSLKSLSRMKMHRGSHARCIHDLQRVAISSLASAAGKLFTNMNGFLIDLPMHENLGDSFIWSGETMILSHLSIGVRIRARSSVQEVQPIYSKYASCRRDAPRLIDANTIYTEAMNNGTTRCYLFFHGGGNFGDLYQQHNRERFEYLSLFPNCASIMFPQSIFYENKTLSDLDCEMFGKYRNKLTIMIRDRESMSFFERQRCSNEKLKFLLAPDSAFALGPIVPLCDAIYDVVYLRRSDKEKVSRLQSDVVKRLHQQNLTVWVGDWNGYTEFFHHEKPGVEDNIMEVPHYRLAAANKLLCQGRVVLTDRLHASILSILMHRPVVALDNTYGKIKNVISTTTEFSKFCTRDVMGIKLVTTIEEAVSAVNRIILSSFTNGSKRLLVDSSYKHF